MPVDTPTAQYIEHAPEWSVMRDVIGGERKIKAATTKYLPKLSVQTDEEYRNGYLKRAYFFNATGRVKDTMQGMVFRRDMTFEAPERVRDLAGDITLTGVTLRDFAEHVVGQMLEVTHGGILVDFPVVDLEGQQKTLVQAQAENLRPYMRFYRAEDIVGWKVRVRNGKQELAQVRLVECHTENDPTDEFAEEESIRYRVIEIDEAGNYRVRILVPVTKKSGNGAESTDYEEVAAYYPMMNGKPLDYVPFFMLGNANSLEDVNIPLLYDLARVNLAHYLNTADMEHGLHFTGLPTPWVAGVSDTDQVFRIGSGSAWVFGDPSAKAGFLEFTGQGLKALREALQDKEAMMAALGARILAPEKKAAEAEGTVDLRRQGEVSVLAALANHISRQLTLAMEIVRDWSGATGDVSVKLNTDYNVSRLSPQHITSLLQSVVAGQISPETFYETLVDGEAVKSSRTFKEERTLISDQA